MNKYKIDGQTDRKIENGSGHHFEAQKDQQKTEINRQINRQIENGSGHHFEAQKCWQKRK